jgi:hypothetical protein
VSYALYVWRKISSRVIVGEEKMKKQLITLKPEEFKLLKSALGKDLKNKCDFCGVKITAKNYGYLAKDTVSCKNIVCLTEAVQKENKDENAEAFKEDE